MTDAPPPAPRDELLVHIPNLRAFAVSVVGPDRRADDLVQETLVKAWRNLGSFTEGTNMRAWLFTILRNVYISDIRRRRREVQDTDGMFAEGVAVAPSQNGHMDLADFRKALTLLPEEQREALILIGAAEFSYEEAAEISGCAVGTVKRPSQSRPKRASRSASISTSRTSGSTRNSARALGSSARRGGRLSALRSSRTMPMSLDAR